MELLQERAEGVLWLTMNRPEVLNALGGNMMWDLLTALTEAATDPEIGCVVLTGAGRGFSAGGDMKARATGAKPPPATPEAGADELRSRMECSRLLHEMPKPTIAMVNGVAAGAGMSLALACDMRVAGTSARMTTAFANMGFSGDFGGHYFLAKLVGPAKARELYFTSAKLDSTQMERLGLVNRLVPDEQLRAETEALARQLGQGPRVAWRYMKRNMKVAEEGTLAEALDAEAIGMMRTRETADHQEALRAFMEKRPPRFQGK
ncbi:enoyl-CoA hydratase [Belnapia sp. T6]|uniref:Enoyl-CoA hydratase n=1 Tax=Belnapia mucosa TaxID=2804532 RepID=A0ABS1V4P9_9PROT|nr:enoyl-CoA hydratase [Belnapia mucosa]MBL6456655.1 enoyl-CoA hydratase [Belnapia mucosa]